MSWRIESGERGVPGFGAQRLEVADLAFSEDQHPSAPDGGIESGQREPGLLRIRVGDAATEPGRSREELDLERGRRAGAQFIEHHRPP